jgi:RNA recognition motif-containing protein
MPKGYAFVEFETVEAAKALLRANGAPLAGRKIVIRQASPHQK